MLVACENVRFSSLFAAGNVSRGLTVVTQANMSREMGKQVVSTRAKDANKLIAWLNFFYWNRYWTNAWQSVMSKKLSQRPIDKKKITKKALLVFFFFVTNSTIRKPPKKTFRMDK